MRSSLTILALALAIGFARSQEPATQPDPVTAAKQRQVEKDKLELDILVAKTKANAGCCCGKVCDCPPGQCSRDRVMKLDLAYEKSRKERKPIVEFIGCEPRCSADAICVKTTIAESPNKTESIRILIPKGSGFELQVLPADSSRAKIVEAVEAAKKRIDKP